jgi:demethylmenaquinone methyltransferase / 2-methoxy-6-polyprenyl-1,4-benzoquinol methylase
MLEIAERTVCLHIVAQRRAAGRDRLAENRADRGDQPCRASRADRGGLTAGRQARAIERLAGVNIAEPGDDALVEQRRLYRRQPAGELPCQKRGVEAGAERLRSQHGQERVPGRLATPQIVDRTEAARIVEADEGAIVELDQHMVVRPGRERSGAGGDAARHAEVQQQQTVGVQLDQDVFAAAVERADPRAVEPGREIRRKRPAQIAAAQQGANDATAADPCREAAPHRFDFRQFGHLPPPFLRLGHHGAGAATRVSSCPMIGRETSGGVRLHSSPPAGRAPARGKAALVRAVFDSVAPRYDVMNDLMSAGIHRRWKAEMVARLKPQPGQLLVDAAGGTGDIAFLALPRLDPAGGRGGVIVCDANERMLAVGRDRALDRGILAGLEWVCADAERLPLTDRSADLYTIAFGLRNVTRIEAALGEARRVLRPGGRFSCLEFTPAVTPLLQPFYDLYSFLFVPLLGQIVAGDRAAYAYLVDSIRRFPEQSALSEMLAAAGFEQVRFRNLTGGIAALHSAWRF